MADCCAGVAQQTAEVNALSSKLQYDSAAQLQNQSLADNQEDSRAWAALKYRIAQNNEAFDHAIRMGSVIAGQAGVTEQQQTVSPIRTGSGDAIAAVPGVAAGQVSANIADIATIVKAVVGEALSAVLPALITAVGGASTPSQTKPPEGGATA